MILLDFIFLIAVLLVFFTGFLFAPLGLGGGLLFVPILPLAHVRAFLVNARTQTKTRTRNINAES